MLDIWLQLVHYLLHSVAAVAVETDSENATRISTESKITCNLTPFLDMVQTDKYGEELNLGSSTELLKLGCHENDADKNWVDDYRREYNLDDDLTNEYKNDYNARDISKNLSVEGKLSYSALSVAGEYEGDYLTAKGEINVGNVETHGTLYAGLVDKDGEFNPAL